MNPQSTKEEVVLLFSESVEVMGELLGAASEIRDRHAIRCVAAAIGPAAEAVAAQADACGADEVIQLRSRQAEALDGEEAMASGLVAAVRLVSPGVVLAGATRTGAAVAARAAQALKLPYASNCITLDIDDDGHLHVERRVYGGRFIARQRLVVAPRMATIPPRRFPAPGRVERAPASVRSLEIEPPQARVRTLGTTERSRSADDVTKADVIVAAGRGVKKQEDLRLLDALAKRLGGVLAGSRPLTGDVDWMPIDRRIGLSGQTVRPALYVACGISGQIEHIVGMKGARTVVAINNDPKAPIHEEADYSVIGDLYEIVPALDRACEQAKARAR